MKNKVITQIRLTAMLMIVFEHCFCFYGVWDYDSLSIETYIKLSTIFVTISLPIFVFISGILYFQKTIIENKYNDNKSFIINKIERLLIPYFFWGFIILITLSNIYQPIRFIYGISHLWFLLMLFNIFIIIQLTKDKWIKTTFKQDICILFSLWLIHIIEPLLHFNLHILCISKMLAYLPYFYLSLIIVKNNDYISMLNLKKYFFIPILLIIIAVAIYSNSWPRTFLVILTSISDIFLCIILSSIIYKNKISQKTCKLISSLDKNSLGIYIFHHIFIEWLLLTSYKNYMNTNYIIAPLILFIFVFISSWLCSNFFQKNIFLRKILG